MSNAYHDKSMRLLRARIKREMVGRAADLAAVDRETERQSALAALRAWEHAAYALQDPQQRLLYSLALKHWTRQAAEGTLDPHGPRAFYQADPEDAYDEIMGYEEEVGSVWVGDEVEPARVGE